MKYNEDDYQVIHDALESVQFKINRLKKSRTYLQNERVKMLSTESCLLRVELYQGKYTAYVLFPKKEVNEEKKHPYLEVMSYDEIILNLDEDMKEIFSVGIKRNLKSTGYRPWRQELHPFEDYSILTEKEKGVMGTLRFQDFYTFNFSKPRENYHITFNDFNSNGEHPIIAQKYRSKREGVEISIDSDLNSLERYGEDLSDQMEKGFRQKYILKACRNYFHKYIPIIKKYINNGQ